MTREEDRPSPTRQTYKLSNTLFKNSFCSLSEYIGSYEKFDSTMSEEKPLIVFERGDAVAALLYDPTYREVILVEQFRLPTLNKGQGGGWILELPAGIPRGDETVHATLVREMLEETGYQISQFVPIANFFPSPGATTEKIYLVYAEVRRAQKKERGGGVEADAENIRIVHMPLAEFFAKLRAREFEDAKLIMAAQWLKDRLATRLADDIEATPPVEHVLDLPAVRSPFGRSKKPEKIIGYIKGNIDKVMGVDVWVNPLTSDMLLDRYTDRTVSAVIRSCGAEKHEDGRIKRDVIGNALRDAMGDRHFVDLAKVIDTSSGELQRDKGVLRIFHVATMRVVFGETQHVDHDTLDRCIDNVLKAIEKKGRYRSVAIPMIGTGGGGLLVNEVAPRLLDRAIAFFEANPTAKLRRIYLLGYSDIDAQVLTGAFLARRKKFVTLSSAEPETT